MESFNQYISKEKGEIKLSPVEKASMKQVILEFMAEHPLPKETETDLPIKSPYVFVTGEWFRMTVGALLVIVLAGGGVAFAAEGAVPGDALYSVKIKVTESVRDTLTFSAESKTIWQANKASRRLEEAEKLAALGKLSPDARQIIEEKFEEHAREFEANLATLPEKDASTVGGMIRDDFSTSLRAHEDLLSEIADAREELRTEVGPIVSLVRSNRLTRSIGVALEKPKAASAVLEISADASNISGTATSAMRVQNDELVKERQEVDASVAKLKKQIIEDKIKLKARIFKQAEKELKEAEDRLKEGEELLNKDIRTKTPDEAKRSQFLLLEVKQKVSESKIKADVEARTREILKRHGKLELMLEIQNRLDAGGEVGIDEKVDMGEGQGGSQTGGVDGEIKISD